MRLTRSAECHFNSSSRTLHIGCNLCVWRRTNSTMPRKLKTGVSTWVCLRAAIIRSIYRRPSVKLFSCTVSSITATPTIITYMHHKRLLTVIILNRKASFASEISQSRWHQTVINWIRQSQSLWRAITFTRRHHFIERGAFHLSDGDIIPVPSVRNLGSCFDEAIAKSSWIGWSTRLSTSFDRSGPFDDKFRHPWQYNTSTVLSCRGSSIVTVFWLSWKMTSWMGKLPIFNCAMWIIYGRGSTITTRRS